MYFGTDSAISTKINDNIYRLSEDGQKIWIIDNQIIFCSGRMEIVKNIMSKFLNQCSKSINDLKNIAKEYYEDYIINNNIVSETFLLDILIGNIKHKQSIVYQISPYNDFQIIERKILLHNQFGIWTGGIKTRELFNIAHINLVNNKTIQEVYQNTFDFVSYEGIGGNLFIYKLDNKNGCQLYYNNKIKEKDIQYINVDLCKQLIVAEQVYGKLGIFAQVRANQIVVGDQNEHISPELVEIGAGTTFQDGYNPSLPNINLLKNGGAEIYTGKSGTNIPDDWLTWTNNGSHFTRRTTPDWIIAGNASFEINQGVPNAGSASYFQDFLNPKVGKEYTASCLMGAHRCICVLVLQFLNVSNFGLGSYSAATGSNSPVKLMITQTVPANTAKIRIKLQKLDTYADQTSSYLFADNVKLEEGNVSTAYVEYGQEINSHDANESPHNLPSYCKMQADGFKVFDALNNLRCHLGQYQPDQYGLLVKDKTGSNTILDEDGILQTWQEGRADNIANGSPLILNVYLPTETKSVYKAILRFKRLAFRAYSTAAASGGGHTVSISANTTGASSTTTTGPSSTSTTSANSHTHTYGEKSISLTHAFNTRTTSTASSHSHTVDDKSVNSAYLGIDTTWVGGTHSHGMDHTHSLSHTHGMSHDHAISSHSHGITYGIYTGTTSGDITIVVNSTIIGTYNSDQTNLDIKNNLVIGQWNIVELSASSLGRIDASIFIQAKMGV